MRLLTYVSSCSGIIALLLLGGCSHSAPQNSSTPPVRNFLLITVDTLRADRLGCYGYKQIKTPHIDRLAQEGVMFRRAIAQVPLTLPSHYSIMTGTYPTVHGVRDNSGKGTGRSVFLAEILRNKGLHTAGFVGSFVLESRFGLNRGFEVYGDRFAAAADDRTTAESVERKGAEVGQEAIDWIRSLGGQSFFAWVHLYDPHFPYDPPEPFRSEYRDRLYDGEVAYVDSVVGCLLDFLAANQLSATTAIILAADHGEGLGEHGEKTHGLFLYDSTVHVPLILKIPGAEVARRIEESTVRNIDIAPTILQVLGSTVPAEMQGVSLLPTEASQHGTVPDHPTYVESYYSRYHFGWSELKAWRTREYKYIQAPKPELYDLAADPHETRNLFSTAGGIAGKLRKSIEAEDSGRNVDFLNPERRDAETMRRLQSLGYLGAPLAAVLKGSSGKRADPKDKRAVLDMYMLALAAYTKRNITESTEMFRQVLQLDPMLLDAYIYLGLGLQGQDRHHQAIEQFKAGLKVDPDNALLYYDLGVSYLALGRMDDALRAFETTIGIDSHYYKAFERMGFIWMRRNRIERAISTFRKAVEINPHSATSQYDLGVLYCRQGNFEFCTVRLEKAIELEPRKADAYNALGAAYFSRDELGKAVQYYLKAISIQPRRADYYYNLGMVYGKQRQIELAIENFEIAVKLNPQYDGAHYYLAMSYLQVGLETKASEHFRKTRRPAPGVFR